MAQRVIQYRPLPFRSSEALSMRPPRMRTRRKMVLGAARTEEKETVREREEAERWPEGSEERKADLKAADCHSSDRSRWLGVVEVSRESAAYYRRIARDER